MKNQEHWKATKFSVSNAYKLRVPALPGEVGPGSILMATLIGRWYQHQLSRYARGTLLDLGCGKVPLYEMYSAFVDHVICTDWPQSLHGRTFIDFASDLNVGIALGNETADTVILSDVLEHIYCPHELLHEICRVLKPGGMALINMPFIYWIHEAPFDFYRYTQFAIERMARDAGFDVVQLDSVGGGGLVLVDVFGKILTRFPHLGGHVASAIQRLALFKIQETPRSSTYPLFVAAVLKKPERIA
jgi:SAM-dependent methyltransferase